MDNLCKLRDEIATKQIDSARQILKELGVNKLGLWNEEFIDTYEEDVRYSEEDAMLFGSLKPDFYLDLDQGGNEDECAGRIFAVELVGGFLKLVGTDDWSSKVFRADARNVDYTYEYLDM